MAFGTARDHKIERFLHVKASMDFAIVFFILLLMAVGCIFIRSLSNNDQYFHRQLCYLAVGLVVMLLCSKIDYHIFESFCFVLFFAAIVFNIILLISTNGHLNRYIILKNFSINVPNLTVCIATFQMASVLSFYKIKGNFFDNFDFFIALLGYGIAPGLLLLINAAFSYFIIYFLILTILFSIKKPGVVISVFFSCAFFVFLIEKIALISTKLSEKMEPIATRLIIWENPFIDQWNHGYDTVQCLHAIASGGIFGVGIGNGIAKNFVPNLLSNLTLAGINQEIGGFGVVMILFVYLFLLYRGLNAAFHAPDKLGFYYAIAINARILTLVVLHTGVTTKLLPLVGVSLPFISYSGSSIVFDCLCIGILLNISRNSRVQLQGD